MSKGAIDINAGHLQYVLDSIARERLDARLDPDTPRPPSWRDLHLDEQGNYEPPKLGDAQLVYVSEDDLRCV